MSWVARYERAWNRRSHKSQRNRLNIYNINPSKMFQSTTCCVLSAKVRNVLAQNMKICLPSNCEQYSFQKYHFRFSRSTLMFKILHDVGWTGHSWFFMTARNVWTAEPENVPVRATPAINDKFFIILECTLINHYLWPGPLVRDHLFSM